MRAALENLLIYKAYHGKLIFFMCLMYLITYMINVKYVNLLFSVLILAVFFMSLLKADKKIALFSLSMFLVGVLFILYTGKGMEYFMEGVLINIPILSLMLIVPLISIPFRLGGYLYPIKLYLLRIHKDSNSFFTFITFIIFFLGPIMSIGVIKILHDVIGNFKIKAELLAKGYLGGYSTVVIWSPYHASVALVLYYLDVSVGEYMPFALAFSIILLLFLNVLFRMQPINKNNSIHPVDLEENTQHVSDVTLSKLLILVSLLMSIILFVEFISKWQMTFIVALMAVLFPIIWGCYQKQLLGVYHEFEKFSHGLAKNANNEVVLFIGAGLLGISLKDTVLMEKFQHLINSVFDQSYLLFMLVIVLIVLFFTFIGIHQVVIVSALLMQMDPEKMGTSAVVLALLFMLSWSMSAVSSPVNPLNLIVSHLIQRQGVVTGLKFNGIYLLCMAILGFIYIYFLHLFMDGV